MRLSRRRFRITLRRPGSIVYLVLYDGSFGVHNGPYSISLLDAAENWIREELNK